MKNLIALSFVLFAATISISRAEPQANPKCSSDDELAQMGFVIHSPAEFDAISAGLGGKLASKPGDFHASMPTQFWSTYARAWVTFMEYDDTTTPADLMKGDIVRLSIRGGDYFELRWFEGGKRHLVYRNSECATNLIPWADNSLY